MIAYFCELMKGGVDLSNRFDKQCKSINTPKNVQNL